MKKLQFFKYAFYMMALGLIFTSCEEDPFIGGGGGGGGIFDNAPSAGLLADPGFVAGSATVDPGQVFNVRYSAVAGDSNMESVSIRENGSLVDFSRITINGLAANSNPILLFDTDTASFTWDIGIAAQQSGDSQYTISVADANGNITDTPISISVAVDVVPPSVSGTTSGNIMVEAGSLFKIPISATPGSVQLNAVAVTENGEIITDVSRLFYGEMSFTENPMLLPSEDWDGLETCVGIRAGDASALYEIFIIDDNEELSSVEVNVEVGSAGTPLDDILEGVLFNSSGPMGFGGLDLDDAIGTGSTDEIAEIRDSGADFTLPDPQNWRQQIGGTNGSIVRELVAGNNGLSETYSFEGVSSKEEIAALFDAGIPFTEMVNGNPVSRRVEVGYSFVVENNDKYYLIVIREINIDSEMNGDNYVLDIKK